MLSYSSAARASEPRERPHQQRLEKVLMRGKDREVRDALNCQYKYIIRWGNSRSYMSSIGSIFGLNNSAIAENITVSWDNN